MSEKNIQNDKIITHIKTKKHLLKIEQLKCI